MKNKMDIKKLYDFKIHPQYFGLGFIQLKINNYERYHFYHPSLLPIVNIEEVHNHRYDFLSEVLLGSITNKIYNFNLNENGNFICENETCSADKKLTEIEKNKQRGNIVLDSVNIINAGTKYKMDFNVFHAIEAQYCITKLTRSDYLQPYAQVIREVNADIICPFLKPMSLDQCWNIIKDVINYEK